MIFATNSPLVPEAIGSKRSVCGRNCDSRHGHGSATLSSDAPSLVTSAVAPDGDACATPLASSTRTNRADGQCLSSQLTTSSFCWRDLSRRSHPEFRDKNRRDVGQLQSKWTAYRWKRPAHRLQVEYTNAAPPPPPPPPAVAPRGASSRKPFHSSARCARTHALLIRRVPLGYQRAADGSTSLGLRVSHPQLWRWRWWQRSQPL
jgi:hypothetical protein